MLPIGSSTTPMLIFEELVELYDTELKITETFLQVSNRAISKSFLLGK